MIFRETVLGGAFLIEPEPVEDERGVFARVWCQTEFEAQGLKAGWVQNSLSVNKHKGTLRGMHYQIAPHEEIKLVRCTKGAIYDVLVDLRPASSTYCQYVGVELSAENRRMLFIPEMFAHGFLTLEDRTEVFYHMSAYHAPAYARGFRWDDPTFEIIWPDTIELMSEKDRNWPPFVRDRGMRS